MMIKNKRKNIYEILSLCINCYDYRQDRRIEKSEVVKTNIHLDDRRLSDEKHYSIKTQVAFLVSNNYSDAQKMSGRRVAFRG